MVRGEVTTSLGRASFVGNSVLRVMADAMAAVCHLTLRYLDWLSLQFLPDTAEHEWLDRHGDIWLVNADGSTGRKVATFASGSITIFGDQGAIIPAGTRLTGSDDWPYETTQQVFANGDIGAAFDPDTSASLLQGFKIAQDAGPLQRRALAINRDMTGANEQPGVEGGSFLQHQVICDNDCPNLRGGGRQPQCR